MFGLLVGVNELGLFILFPERGRELAEICHSGVAFFELLNSLLFRLEVGRPLIELVNYSLLVLVVFDFPRIDELMVSGIHREPARAEVPT